MKPRPGAFLVHHDAMSPNILDTYSGRKLDLDAPMPDQIAVADIAAGLSKICRFGAQAATFFSVAQHAVIVHNAVCAAGRPGLALPALHHDSHEAYLGDVLTPVKRKLGFGQRQSDYKNLSDALDIAIGRSFGYDWLSDRDDIALVKRADHQALLAEAALLLHDAGDGIRRALEAEGIDVDGLAPLPEVGPPLDPPTAERLFVAAHEAARAGETTSRGRSLTERR